MVLIAFKLPDEDKISLEALSLQLDLSVSQILRKLVKELVGAKP
jgi:hypothetical protein